MYRSATDTNCYKPLWGLAMRNNQKFTPKYWVGNNKESDDVVITTARKSYHDAEKKLISIVGENYEDEGYEIKCIEIRLVTDGLSNYSQ